MAVFEVRLFETATWVASDVIADSEDEAIEIAKELFDTDNNYLVQVEQSVDEQVPYVIELA